MTFGVCYGVIINDNYGIDLTKKLNNLKQINL